MSIKSSQWCHPTISSSVVPFSSCPWSLPASGSFPMSQLFAWGGQSIWVWASASVLPMIPIINSHFFPSSALGSHSSSCFLYEFDYIRYQFSTSLPTLVSFVFVILTVAILRSMRWCPTVVWFASPLWLVTLSASCVCWSFVYLLRGNVCSSSLPVFWSHDLFSCWVVGVLYIVWVFIPYQIYKDYIIYNIANIPSCSIGCFFTLLIVSLEAQKFLIIHGVQFIYFYLCCLCFWRHIQKMIAKFNVKELSSMFSAKSFIVLALVFRSLIHFELIFLYSVR